jgi:LmbE family N-acetylglucosaminyl deacetylase
VISAPGQPRRAIAIAAHPDDIEFLMAGTLWLLKEAGWETFYLTLSSGNCGSTRTNAGETRRARAAESRAAARLLGASWLPSLADDLEIVYEVPLLRRLAAVIREVKPAVVLTHSPQDYMEDHTNTSRLAVTAAFSRGMPNFQTSPRRAAADFDATVYHALPHGLRDGLRRRVMPGSFVNTTSARAVKLAALSAHQSQQEWLETSQGMNSFLRTMEEQSLAVGRMSRKFKHAEGWRRHSHLGFSSVETDPLGDALGKNYLVNRAYERDLENG